jgi:hypothetical protein
MVQLLRSGIKVVPAAVFLALLAAPTTAVAQCSVLPDGYASLTVGWSWKLTVDSWHGAIFVKNNSTTETARNVFIFIDGVPYFKHKAWEHKAAISLGIAPQQTMAYQFSSDLIDVNTVRVTWNDELGQHSTPTLQTATLPYTMPPPRVTGGREVITWLKKQVSVDGYFNLEAFLKTVLAVIGLAGLIGNIVSWLSRKKDEKRTALRLYRREYKSSMYACFGVDAPATEVRVENPSSTATATGVRVCVQGGSECLITNVPDLPPHQQEVVSFSDLSDDARIHVEWNDGRGVNKTNPMQVKTLAKFE